MIHFVTILFLPVLVAAANAAQQAPACPFTEANYGPFAAADVKLIQDACDPYSIITMQQFCRACTCAINRGLVTSLERAESLIGNMTARKAFLSVSTGNSTLTQVPGLAKCGSLETEVLLKSGAMTKETVSVSSSCWNLGAEFLLEVYDSCDYSRSASSGAARLTSNSHNMMLLVAVVSMMLTTMQFT